MRKLIDARIGCLIAPLAIQVTENELDTRKSRASAFIFFLMAVAIPLSPLLDLLWGSVLRQLPSYLSPAQVATYIFDQVVTR